MAELSAPELERLREAAGRADVDPARPLFEPGSTTWRVQREAALLLAGGRALLLQVAHPLVAEGVAAWSDFEARPLERLLRTLKLTLDIVFSDAATALRSVQEIERVHARVNGRLEEEVGPFPAGTPYDANDPALLWWVYSTLLESSVDGYRRFVGRLGEADCEALYRESIVASRLFGIPDGLRPRSWADFQVWFAELVAGDTLAVGRQGREVANAVLAPRLPWGSGHAVRALRFFSMGQLPESLWERFGDGFGPVRGVTLRGMAAAARSARWIVPRRWRWFPTARRAWSS